MFDFLFKKAPKVDKLEVLKKQYSIVKNFYSKETISFERKQELSSLIEKYGYLPYSQTKAIEQLTPTEVIFCLEKKLELNNTFKENNLNFDENEISAVKRAGYQNAGAVRENVQRFTALIPIP